jgi:hypothetical protein
MMQSRKYRVKAEMGSVLRYTPKMTWIGTSKEGALWYPAIISGYPASLTLF